jgi:hypothetical protein
MPADVHKILFLFGKEELPPQWKESMVVPIYKNGDRE